ncbi:MAG: TetR/AcrR family transcriptional regulator [Simkaniaceae bacterium]|nr:MAG: TetR/AcrR family transcriptional regulator [Simkaniaceae bacterium]
MSRNELRKKILNLGWGVLETGTGLRIRDLAKGCGCSIGTVYNLFEGMDEIVLRLNAKSLDILYGGILKALEGENDLKSGVRAMGASYTQFAKDHPHRWKMLFENESVERAPQWYLDVVNAKLREIESELVRRFYLKMEEAMKLVGFFWAAIHGITSIMLNKKMRVVEGIIKEEDLDAYVDHCLMGMIP